MPKTKVSINFIISPFVSNAFIVLCVPKLVT